MKELKEEKKDKMDKWEYGYKYGFNKEVEEPGITIIKEE